MLRCCRNVRDAAADLKPGKEEKLDRSEDHHTSGSCLFRFSQGEQDSSSSDGGDVMLNGSK